MGAQSPLLSFADERSSGHSFIHCRRPPAYTSTSTTTTTLASAPTSSCLASSCPGPDTLPAFSFFSLAPHRRASSAALLIQPRRAPHWARICDLPGRCGSSFVSPSALHRPHAAAASTSSSTQKIKNTFMGGSPGERASAAPSSQRESSLRQTSDVPLCSPLKDHRPTSADADRCRSHAKLPARTGR